MSLLHTILLGNAIFYYILYFILSRDLLCRNHHSTARHNKHQSNTNKPHKKSKYKKKKKRLDI